MVDVSAKAPTTRRATASAVVLLGQNAFAAICGGQVAKGDVLAVARVAGIQAAKRTSELIPLCHGLSPDAVQIGFEELPPDRLRIVSTVSIVARTGVEMEAMVAASIAALTVYDMCKSVSKSITIQTVQLESKVGGKSGDWAR